MGRKLNVIGFISGGKDSFFSLLHCLANGHNIVALANLYPPLSLTSGDGENFDLNSFMYQTVGHSLIPLYSEICSLPLYRQEIQGTAINQAKDYSVTDQQADDSSKRVLQVSTNREDETESMLTLLQRIKDEHPEADAVCSGAILSTYQRTRIESVALRMDTVPLAYLWQYPRLPTPVSREDGLLEDMAAVGLDARIVKIASGGLDEDLLWENVCAEMTRKKIARVMKRFGGSVLGEGGEFETIVIGGPPEIFNGAIEVDEVHRKVLRGSGGEAWLAFAGGSVKTVEKETTREIKSIRELRIPNLLDEPFAKLLKTLEDRTMSTPTSQSNLAAQGFSPEQHAWTITESIWVGKRTTRVSNLSASSIDNDTRTQMTKIGERIRFLVKEVLHRSPYDIVFSTILLRSMDDFQAVNQEYAKLFLTQPNPPARVTVACGDNLPSGVSVMLSLVISHHRHEMDPRLHVQSMSYWAPANIGPYSQATTISLDIRNAAIVFIAGQIPLVPASMDLVTVNDHSQASGSDGALAVFRLQATLSLQHLWRIAESMSVGWWIGAVAYVVSDAKDIHQKASIAASAWTMMHRQRDDSMSSDPETAAHDADFDVWDQQHKSGGSFQLVQEHETLPNFARLSIISADVAEVHNTRTAVSPFFAVQVDHLPRGSDIEWQALGASRAPIKFFETVSEFGYSLTVCSLASDEMVFGSIGIEFLNTDSGLNLRIDEALLAFQKRCQVGSIADMHLTIYSRHKTEYGKAKVQLVPCKSVWSMDGKELAAAIVVTYETAMPAFEERTNLQS
ncbi:MAG: hypothetical protein Q9222_003930 [Ikaeria aurantiellina]